MNAETAERRARALHHELLATLCDVHEPWAHGTVVRATRFPHFYDLNVVRVESPPRMGVAELIAFADEALAGLDHRRMDFADAGLGESMRGGALRRSARAPRALALRGLPGGRPD
jgi:hypothetical protein